MLDNELATKALGLTNPWFVEKMDFDTSGLVTNVYINFVKGSKFKDDETGVEYGAYRTSIRKVKHLFLWQYETYLHVRIPEIKTDTGKIKTVSFPLFDK